MTTKRKRPSPRRLHPVQPSRAKFAQPSQRNCGHRRAVTAETDLLAGRVPANVVNPEVLRFQAAESTPA